MGDKTKIEWADSSWNPWWGCTAVSVGDKGACVNCYAEAMAHRFGVGWGPHAARRRSGPKHLALPFKWERQAQRDGARPFVFCASMADIFDNQVPPEWRAEAFATMRACPSLVFLLLTKRPSMIEALAIEASGLPPNAAIGASIVTQAEAERDVPVLLRAAVELSPAFTFISAEPLMEPLALRPRHDYSDAGHGPAWLGPDRGDVNWVIAGGESGPHARPSHPDWFRGLRDQCAAAGVPFLFKQWGEWAPHDAWRAPPMRQEPGWPTIYRTGKKHAGRSLDGRTHDGFPPGFGKDERAAA